MYGPSTCPCVSRINPASAMSLQQAIMHSVDVLYATIPRRAPTPEALARARLVAHRGAWGSGRLENTLGAFDAALDAGIWGIELDLRWSADLQPVILHDSDCRRVFEQDCTPAQVTCEELKRRVPDLPTLAEVVARYGRKL